MGTETFRVSALAKGISVEIRNNAAYLHIILRGNCGYSFRDECDPMPVANGLEIGAFSLCVAFLGRLYIVLFVSSRTFEDVSCGIGKERR